MVDPATVKKYEELIKAAKAVNQEPVEVLARWGMLRREKEDAIAGIVAAYRALEEQDAAKILKVFTGKDSGTPADMFRAVMLWFEAYIEGKERELK